MQLLLDHGGIETPIAPGDCPSITGEEWTPRGWPCTPLAMAQVNGHCQTVDVLASRYCSEDRIRALMVLGSFLVRFNVLDVATLTWSKSLNEADQNRAKRAQESSLDAVDLSEPNDPRFPPLAPVAEYGVVREARTVAEMVAMSEDELRDMSCVVLTRLLGPECEDTILSIRNHARYLAAAGRTDRCVALWTSFGNRYSSMFADVVRAEANNPAPFGPVRPELLCLVCSFLLCKTRFTS